MGIISNIKDKIALSRIRKLNSDSNALLNNIRLLRDSIDHGDNASRNILLSDLNKSIRKLAKGRSVFLPYNPIKERREDRDRTILYNGMYINNYNLADLYHAYTKETYFKTSVDKYIEGVIKRGFHIQSRTPEVVKYLNKRLKELEFVSLTSLSEMIRSFLFSTLLYGNVFFLRMRNESKSSGEPHIWRGRNVKPIAGFKILDPRRIIIYIDGNNNKKYAVTQGKVQPSKPGAMSDFEKLYKSIINFPRYFMGYFGFSGMSMKIFDNYIDSYKYKSYSISDVDHIRYHPTPGEEWAMPPFWPVLEDINMLRSIETAVDLLIYQFGSVLIHVQVSNPIQNAINNVIKRPPSDSDILDVRNAINSMDSNGFIVTGDHVKMNVLNVAQNIIRLEDYLLYFKERVFTGLWLSSVITGESSNGIARSVADTIMEEKTSKIIELQRLLKEAIDDLLFELLLEAGLTPNEILDKDIYPELIFDDVDMELELKKQDATLRLWEGGLITEQEARMMLNKDTIDDKEREYTYPRLVKAYLLKVKEEMAIEAVEEETLNSKESKQAENNITPENQTGKKYNTKKAVNK